jgi:HNH endonuclease
MNRSPVQGPDGRFVTQDVQDRFWSKVDRYTECWLWTGTKTPEGYGQFWDGERAVMAHRYAYELLVGSIPESMELDHLCRVRDCVWPGHLEPVTSRENVHRSLSPMGINSRLTRCRRGHEFTGIWRGRRTCRTCTRGRMRAHRARRAA